MMEQTVFPLEWLFAEFSHSDILPYISVNKHETSRNYHRNQVHFAAFSCFRFFPFYDKRKCNFLVCYVTQMAWKSIFCHKYFLYIDLYRPESLFFQSSFQSILKSWLTSTSSCQAIMSTWSIQICYLQNCPQLKQLRKVRF